jgi:two-component system invasion response regulator UvrY
MIRILLVEDHAIVRRGLTELFKDEFKSVTIGEAENCAKAIALMATDTWDVVLLDINIPGRDGLDLLEEIRRIHPQIPVLVLSAYPEDEFAFRSFKLGASGYLNKSRAPEELVAAVKKVMGGGRYVTPSLAEKLAAYVGGEYPSTAHEALSSRELQVLGLVARGNTIKEIAGQLSLSEKTIATYRSRIGRKTGLTNNVELARYALQHKLSD